MGEAVAGLGKKLLAVAVTLVIAGPWMMETLLDYMRHVFTITPAITG